MSAAELRARASPTSAITQVVTRRSEGRSDVQSPEDDKGCHGMDLTMNSSNNFHNTSQDALPLDFRHSSVVNNKLNTINTILMNTFLPLTSGVDKENMDST